VAKSRARRTVSSQIGVSGSTLASKIRKVAHDSPGLSQKQVVGKAVGILKGRRKR